ncbi:MULTISPECIES: ABC transporter substrate-binding protein [Streptomyces]|uniref:Solute-binding transport lipoprotein n=1 Tax=Streptomyces virginiae TaxID=1961 RepID=A0ABQ3NJE4_STRVG|nr:MULTISPECIES: ABC transporter substrate-binding protein [Streptomyces]MBP2343208.1 peptide/nickel transport system substrate-binding protein [Streptomyces virginiae]MCI4080622.1 ABC transporter substrate-binding protein [Streptomyces sp. MMS21 TC-5]QNE28123.1 ABC transporter substrate-binding protein [Streptomyces sp. INR7]RST04719.1 ABC transporter substrate-binding protein [Streptomyces sp. WAC05950]GGQ29313.1 solute-binding transport lipoprotein [Streptomyces virginiae]
MNRRNQWLAAPLGAATAAALLSGCGSTDGSNAGSGKGVVMGISDKVKSTDPASGYDPGSWLLFNNVFQSLLSFPKGGTTPEPDAAQSCAFEGGDSKLFKCTLKSDLKFSNGHELTSKDVKYSFERTLKINDENGPAVMLASIAGIDAPDDKTVVFRLKTSDATFPSKIASGAGSIVDHREYPADKLRTDNKAVGSGVYKLDSFSEKSATFSVNESYTGKAKAKNTGVTLKFFNGDQAGLKTVLESGDVDFAFRGLAAKDIAALASTKTGDDKVDVVQGTGAEVEHMVFNMNDPVVGKLPVRKAIAYLVDREALVKDVYAGTATALYSIVPTGIAGHTTPFFDRYGGTPQLDKAKAVLKAANINGKVKVTLYSTPSRYGPSTDQQFEVIAKQLNDSGLFEADVKSVEYEQYEKDIQAGKYGIYVKGWVPDYPDADNFTQPFFGPGNVLNNNYDNKEITGTIIPSTSAKSDRTAANTDYNRLQDIVADELPLLPLWQGKQYAVTRQNVNGLQWSLDASTVFRFWEISKG